MLIDNEEALSSLVHVPRNSFASDPFCVKPDDFFKELSDELHIEVNHLESLYRFVPESFIISTIAQAVSFYLQEVKDHKQVAFFVPTSLYRFKNKLTSYALMLDACSLVIQELSGSKSNQLYEKDLDEFNGTALLVEDAMYSGRELTFYVNILFDGCKNIQSVALFLAASTKTSLRFLPPDTKLSVASITPLIEDVVPHTISKQLSAYFHTINTFMVTAHKLPDTMSLHAQARNISKSSGDVILYSNASTQNYPTAAQLAQKTLSLFY